eukprot:GHVO01011473.1.p1 GENE.GHVO01011473.1~~GHVO01011473.1.p1  ORF type:complete len:145 (-),score=22.84 GHVO01011473.1:99-533(-)
MNVTAPWMYPLHVFECLFGLIVSCLEIQAFCVPFGTWLNDHIRILTREKGKNIFSIMVGCIALSVWPPNVLMSTFGTCLILIGTGALVFDYLELPPALYSSPNGGDDTQIIHALLTAAGRREVNDNTPMSVDVTTTYTVYTPRG